MVNKMDKKLEKYLGKMPISEKIDIISELKSQIIEMKMDKK